MFLVLLLFQWFDALVKQSKSAAGNVGGVATLTAVLAILRHLIALSTDATTLLIGVHELSDSPLARPAAATERRVSFGELRFGCLCDGSDRTEFFIDTTIAPPLNKLLKSG